MPHLLVGTVAFLFIAFFAFLFFRKATYLTVTVKVGSDSIFSPGGVPTPWFNQYFYTGMSEKDGFGRKTAEVLYMRSYDTSSSIKAVYLTVKLNTVYSRGSNQYTYKG